MTDIPEDWIDFLLWLRVIERASLLLLFVVAAAILLFQLRKDRTEGTVGSSGDLALNVATPLVILFSIAAFQYIGNFAPLKLNLEISSSAPKIDPLDDPAERPDPDEPGSLGIEYLLPESTARMATFVRQLLLKRSEQTSRMTFTVKEVEDIIRVSLLALQAENTSNEKIDISTLSYDEAVDKIRKIK